jgi:hypothetical protein
VWWVPVTKLGAATKVRQAANPPGLCWRGPMNPTDCNPVGIRLRGLLGCWGRHAVRYLSPSETENDGCARAVDTGGCRDASETEEDPSAKYFFSILLRNMGINLLGN